MIPPALIAIGAIVSWVSAVGLIYAAITASPRIGALTERAVIAVLISLFLTAYTVIAVNTDSEFAYFPFDVAAVALRLASLGLAAIAPLWLVMWYFDRLGDSRMDDLMDAVQENTRISQKASDSADRAYTEANFLNAKIATQGAAIIRQGDEAAATAETITHTADQVDDIHDATVVK